MYDAAMTALAQLTTLQTLLALVAGVVVGLVVGILPGLGGTAGLALLLPLVFGMDPNSALAMMIGLLAVTTTSDTFPSVLMGIPGTSGSQATVLDGFPMTKKGEGTRALSIAFISSSTGTTNWFLGEALPCLPKSPEQGSFAPVKADQGHFLGHLALH